MSFFPITENTYTSYSVGERIAVSGAQELTSESNVNEWKVYADDGVYDSGSDWNDSTFSLTLAGLPNSLRAFLEGGSYDEENDEYTFTSDSEAPEFALSFSSVAGNNTNEFTKVFCAKCTKINFEHKTKGSETSVTPAKVQGYFMPRKVDKAVFTKKDADDGSADWLNEIASVTKTV